MAAPQDTFGAVVYQDKNQSPQTCIMLGPHAHEILICSRSVCREGVNASMEGASKVAKKYYYEALMMISAWFDWLLMVSMYGVGQYPSDPSVDWPYHA